MANTRKENVNMGSRKAACPVCGSEMQANRVLCSNYPECRYDASIDYEKYPALGPVKAGVITVSALKAEHEKKEQERKEAEENRKKQEKEYKDAKKHIEELVKEKSQLNNKINTLEFLKSGLQARLENSEEEKKTLNVRLENSEEDKKTLNARLGLCDIRITQLKNEKEDIEARCRKAEENAAKISEEYKKLYALLQSTEASDKANKEKITVLEKEKTNYPAGACIVCAMILLVILIFNESGVLDVDLNTYTIGKTGLSYAAGIQLYILLYAACALLMYNIEFDSYLMAIMRLALIFSFFPPVILMSYVIDENMLFVLFLGLSVAVNGALLEEQEDLSYSILHIVIGILVGLVWMIVIDINRHDELSHFQVILQYSLGKVGFFIVITTLEISRIACKKIRVSGDKDYLDQINVRAFVMVLHIILMISAYIFTADNNMDISYTISYNPLIVLAEVLGIPITFLLIASAAGEIAILDGVIVAGFFARIFWPDYNTEILSNLLLILAIGAFALIWDVPFEMSRVRVKENNRSDLVYVIAELAMVIGYIVCCYNVRDLEDELKKSGSIAVCFLLVGSAVYSWMRFQEGRTFWWKCDVISKNYSRMRNGLARAFNRQNKAVFITLGVLQFLSFVVACIYEVAWYNNPFGDFSVHLHGYLYLLVFLAYIVWGNRLKRGGKIIMLIVEAVLFPLTYTFCGLSILILMTMTAGIFLNDEKILLSKVIVFAEWIMYVALRLVDREIFHWELLDGLYRRIENYDFGWLAFPYVLLIFFFGTMIYIEKLSITEDIKIKANNISMSIVSVYMMVNWMLSIAYEKGYIEIPEALYCMIRRFWIFGCAGFATIGILTAFRYLNKKTETGD